MKREIKLSGGEITILKSIGLTGQSMHGKQFMERMGEMSPAEFMDDLNGLISLGYVLSDKVNLFKTEDVERANLRVNPSDIRDLRDTIRPGGRREEAGRRRRRT